MIRSVFMLALVAVAAPAPKPPASATASAVVRPTFDLESHPAAPDYRQPSSWASLPDAPGAAAETPAAGASPAVQAAKVDVFFIHPTTYRTQAHWNQDVADQATNAWTDDSVISRQAGIFNACCRVYAPRYRQAATGALDAKDSSGDQAYDLAYSDIARAFDFYIAHDNRGRPFILAGHSQGALMIYRLLADRIDGKPLQRRLVAAYAVGVAASLGDFGRTYKTVRPCLQPAQTGCLVSWNTFLDGADTAAYVARSQSRYIKRYGDAPGRALLCTNPLTFRADRPEADGGDNPGSLPGPVASGPLPPLVAGAVSARCQNGVLVAGMRPGSAAFAFEPLPGGSLHMQDFSLFYEAVRRNAVLRAAAWSGSLD